MMLLKYKSHYTRLLCTRNYNWDTTRLLYICIYIDVTESLSKLDTLLTQALTMEDFQDARLAVAQSCRLGDVGMH